jgi:hypothetical protein
MAFPFYFSALVVLLVIGVSLCPTTVSAVTYWDSLNSCGDKVRRTVSHKAIPSPLLSIDEASLTPHDQVDQKRIGIYYYQLKLPLRKPEGRIVGVWFHAQLNEALELLSLMRQGKIASVLVTTTYAQVGDVLSSMFPLSKGDDSLRGLEACNEDLIIKKMAYCEECRILEWRGVTP